MRWTRLFPALALMSTMTGCLVPETIETRIDLGEPGKLATVTTEYGNISSGEADTADVRKDFNQLLADWQGDKHLLEQAEQGMVVKRRDVFIRDGMIFAVEASVTREKDIADNFSFWVSHGERIMVVDADDDYELVDTNGRILKTEKNSLIVWPEKTTELYWKQQVKELPGSFKANQALMVKWLREYLAEGGGRAN